MFKTQYIYIFIINLLAIPLVTLSKGNTGLTTLKIKYIANEGFIISSGTKQILMDALFEGYHSGYHVEPSNTTINKMKECQAPFDSVDLITISHEHFDHVSPEIVGKHLECNTQGVVICNSVVADMMRSYTNYEQIKSRINSIMPDINSSKNDTINGIPIKVIRFRHAMPQFINMVNLGFVINVNGIKIFHSRDS